MDTDPTNHRPDDHDHDRGQDPDGESVVVDCDRCVVRGPRACGDCVVSVLLGGPPQGVEIDAEERLALDLLADGGLVPPLRLVVPLTGPESHAD